MEEFIKKELTEQQLKFIDEIKKEKVKDTAQEEIEKGNLIDKDKRYVLWLIENKIIRVNSKVEEYLKG